MPASPFDAAGSLEAHSPQGCLPQLPELLSIPFDETLLREQIRQIDGDKVKNVAVLSFRSLLLHRIAKLQAELVKKQNELMDPPDSQQLTSREYKTKIELDKEEEESKKVDCLLPRYGTHGYLEAGFDKRITYNFLGGKGEFVVIERTNKAIWKVPQWLDKSHFQYGTLPRYPIGPLGFRELDKARHFEKTMVEKIRSRFHMALFGGVALIAPVILMTIRPTVVVDLVTVSVSTTLFSLVLVSLASDMSGKDVLTATAGYAAVMVVFLGTSLQVINQKRGRAQPIADEPHTS
ncbi:hypothetical protein NPX13_g6461 [Xylaria arbuscula]|uniref:DUF6594 domain-containing protein n=1 Tax=Xylaria arbuscula TaxID=114810 RepID=A0A9W8NCI3_9PEZI|nr:hypothetical protein NPX13_g6461 [Xylaria arbuscula]